MPIYEYMCDPCHHRFEQLRPLGDTILPPCPKCGGGVKKAASAPAIQFKGSGWYVTDYSRPKGGSPSKGPETPPPAKEAAAGGSKSV